MRVVELSLFVNDDAVHKRDLGCWATKHKTPMPGPRGDERKFSDGCEFRDGPTGGLHPSISVTGRVTLDLALSD